MAEENKEQELRQDSKLAPEEQKPEQGPEQGPEREPAQGEDPGQGEGPASESGEEPKQEEPKEKKEGLLMPILYALLAGVGAFTLVLIIGIVLTFVLQPAQPSETPQGTQAPVQAWQLPSDEAAPGETPFSFL